MRTLLAAALLASAAGAAAPCRAGPDRELYHVVFLRPDPARKPLAPADRERIQAAHMANIRKMADDGVLVSAGPMDDNPTTISGIFVLKVGSLAEALRIASLDPTVVERRNTVDAHPWWGPAGIRRAYFQWKKANPGAADTMAAHALCIVRRGPAWDGGTRLEGEDAGFMETLRLSGALAAAGRLDGDPALLGLLVFKAPSIEEARRSIEGEPAFRSGRLSAEFHTWWSADRVLPW